MPEIRPDSEDTIEVWHWPPKTIELLTHGHTGIKCHDHIYSFWPDTVGYQNDTAIIAPGYEEKDTTKFADRKNPPFWGFFIGVIRKDTIYESATEFFRADMRNLREVYNNPVAGGELNDERLPHVWVFRIPTTAAVVDRARNKLEELRSSPPEYNAPKKLFCTPLVRDILCESGLDWICDLDVKRPVHFAKGLETLAQNKSYQIEKELRIFGIVNTDREGAKFSWILSQEESN